MSKTPFEIRADLLQMANDHLKQQYELNMAFAQEAWKKYLESVKLAEVTTTEQLLALQKNWFEAMQSFMPKAPTIEEITKKAAELYSFVQKKE